MSQRLFVAAWPDASTRRELAGILERLREPEADVKWVPPENLHLTLRFLGDVDAASVPGLEACLAEVIAPAAPFAMRYEKLGTFPPRGAARVIWAGLAEGARELAALAVRVEKALLAGGFLSSAEKRPFRAHLTLGRPRTARGSAPLRDLLEKLSFRSGTHLLEEVTLVESRLTPRGAVYNNVAVFPLRGEGAPNVENHTKE
jgi:2'-5' RNA ligase